MDFFGLKRQSIRVQGQIHSFVAPQSRNANEVKQFLKTRLRGLDTVRGIGKGTEDKERCNHEKLGSRNAKGGMGEPIDAGNKENRGTRLARTKIGLHENQPFLIQKWYRLYSVRFDAAAFRP